jgi:hypothetical protein
MVEDGEKRDESEKESEKHLNNPKFWIRLAPGSGAVHLTVPPTKTSSKAAKEKSSGAGADGAGVGADGGAGAGGGGGGGEVRVMTTSDAATTTAVVLHLDIRFVPRFVYELLHANAPSSPAAPPPPPNDSYFGVAIMPTMPSIDPHVGTLCKKFSLFWPILLIL